MYDVARKEESMKPKKKLIEQAQANGSINRLNQLLSAAHILNCEANDLVSEANDLMIENGLNIGLLKRLHNDFVKSADRYFNEFAALVRTSESKMNMFSDLEAFDKSFREWAKLKPNWKPKEVENEESNP